jgi:hypothetical protein
MQNPTSAQLLHAWEIASQESAVRRPATWLSHSFGWSRHSLESLHLGERNRLVLQARALLFGERMTGLFDCKSCLAKVEFEVPYLALVQSPTPAMKSVQVEGDGFQIVAKLLTVGDLESSAGASSPRSVLFEKSLEQGKWEEHQFEAVVAKTGESLAVADPLAHISFDLECPTCGQKSSPRFDPWTYLWEELVVWAHRLFDQVHVLASAYGWTESEVLSLPASRRMAYLQRVHR